MSAREVYRCDDFHVDKVSPSGMFVAYRWKKDVCGNEYLDHVKYLGYELDEVIAAEVAQ